MQRGVGLLFGSGDGRNRAVVSSAVLYSMNLLACAKQGWGLLGVWVTEIFLHILSVRDTSLVSFVFCAITLISLIQGRSSSPGLI